MQRLTYTYNLLFITKEEKYEHEVLVICTRNKKKSRKFKVIQGSFWSLREYFLTQRVATLHYKE